MSGLSALEIAIAATCGAAVLLALGARFARDLHPGAAPGGWRPLVRLVAVGTASGSGIALLGLAALPLLDAASFGWTARHPAAGDVLSLLCIAGALALVSAHPLAPVVWLLGPVWAAAVAAGLWWLPLLALAVEPTIGGALRAAGAAAVVTGLLVAPARRSRRLAHARLEAMSAGGDGVLVLDAAGRVLETTGAAAEALMTSSSSTRSAIPRIPNVVVQGLSSSRPRRVRLRVASRFLEVWSRDSPSRCTGSALFGVLVRDITKQYRDERSLVRLAHYDSLTGLPNRRLFLETLKRDLAAAEGGGAAAALLYLDLDHFKEVNDSLGHGAGDDLLKQISGRLLEGMRAQDLGPDTMPRGARLTVARLSGDEFAIIASRVVDAEAAREVGRQALRVFDEPFVIAGHTLQTSGSVGVALFPKDGRDTEALIRSADAAVYEAKSRGRGRVALYEAKTESGKERTARIAQALQLAVEREEFRLHYQPKVSTVTGRTEGFEALLRWTSADLGEVSPRDFVPVAEDRGLITEIGAWCLDEACRQIREWRHAGHVPVPVSVNVSSIQFHEDDLQRVIVAALQKHSVEPELLEIELTESLLLDDGDATALCLRDLRAIGVSIALDDFGTGYSALTYLSRFQLDVLKLDRSFLREIHYDGSAEKIVSAVISMAHGLGLKVVAEGVDAVEQLEILRAMECDQIQGFLYSPAVAPEEARALLALAGNEAPEVPFGADHPSKLPVVETRPAFEPSEPAPASDPPPPSPSPARDIPPLLLVDDAVGSLQSLTERLLRIGLGIDLHYANAPDEALLLLAQQDIAPQALAMPPTIDLAPVRALQAKLGDRLGTDPRLVFIGEEPDASTRANLRRLGGASVLWSPFEDAELAFLLKSALAAPHERSRRQDVRVPIDLTAKIQAGQRRELVVLSSLSSRGAFLETSNPPPVGSRLRLDFELPSDAFRFFARVVYQAGEDPDRPLSSSGVGVVFYGSDPGMEQRLRKAVDERAARYLP